MELIIIILQITTLMTIAPLVAGIIKTAKARMQNRRGPSLLQVYFDLLKLFRKGTVRSETVSWIFYAAPFIYLATAAAAAACLPIFTTSYAITDMFILIYLLAAGRFFLVLASLDAGSAFGGMGGSREMFISVLVEPALLLAMLTVAYRAGSTQLGDMVQITANTQFSLHYILAAVAFFIVVVTETGPIPVDNPDTHLELTMIHEAMVLEYSGFYLELIILASCLKQMVMLVLFTMLFLPWGSYLLGLKILTVALGIAVVETSTNKMRLFKVPEFLAVACLLSLLSLIAI